MIRSFQELENQLKASGTVGRVAVACAALETGSITANTTYYCAGTMQFYDQRLRCLNGRAHGTENVTDALRDSCNIFFYNVSQVLGIDKMNAYCELLGLGQSTGAEITESKGTLAGRAEREAAGGTWLLGDTAHAAIGQSDNLFTQLQMVNYCSTIANGGTRYELHFVKAIIAQDRGEITEKEDTVAEETGISEETLDTVHQGMREVATDGAPRYAFSQLDIDLAAKTGTSQVYDGTDEKGKPKYRNNGFLITYGPYENPEIAVSSVVELAGSGTETADLTAAIYNYYFSDNTDEKAGEPTGTLLS